MNYGLLAQLGRREDNSLLGGQVAHISAAEADLLRSMGGAGSTNPVTGLPEYIGTGGGAQGGLGQASGQGGAVGTGQGTGQGTGSAGSEGTYGYNPSVHGISLGSFGQGTGGSASGATGVGPGSSGVGSGISGAALGVGVGEGGTAAPPSQTPTQQIIKQAELYSDLGKKMPKLPISIWMLAKEALEAQTPENILLTSNWLATPQGQASMSPGSTGIGGSQKVVTSPTDPNPYDPYGTLANRTEGAAPDTGLQPTPAALPDLPEPYTPPPIPGALSYTPLPYPTTQYPIPEVPPVGKPIGWPLISNTTLI